MAFDGFFVRCICAELKSLLEGGRVDKIYMPDKDSVIMGIRSLGKNYKLFLSCNPSLPRISLTENTRENPQNPPMFCMLLRKHLSGGKLVSVAQPGMERIIELSVESKNELGDDTQKKLVIEIMGRHSNIILVDENGRVMECARRVDATVSSRRIVIPGARYELPPSQNKISPLDVEENDVIENVLGCPSDVKLDGYILEKFAGISPAIAREAVYRAVGHTDVTAAEVSAEQKRKIAQKLCEIFELAKNGRFTPVFILDDSRTPFDFSAIDLTQFKCEKVDSAANAVDTFYIDREIRTRLSQIGSDMSKYVSILIERASRKAAILQADIEKSEKKEKYKLFGDLITANIYKIKKGDSGVLVQNFYSDEGEEINIPLDKDLSPAENAQKYFKRYNKLKNTQQFAARELEKAMEDIEYLTSVQVSIENCESTKELGEIKSELISEGYLRQRNPGKEKKEKPSSPDCYLSSDGFDIFVGKNNKQNDYLTLKFAKNSDIWFHTKTIPGSHTVISTGGKPVPDKTMEEAAMLAAYYSKARNSINVAVDYTTVKNVKKPAGAKAGMVIYVDYKTAYVTPDKAKIKEMVKK